MYVFFFKSFSTITTLSKLIILGYREIFPNWRLIVCKQIGVDNTTVLIEPEEPELEENVSDTGAGISGEESSDDNINNSGADISALVNQHINTTNKILHIA